MKRYIIISLLCVLMIGTSYLPITQAGGSITGADIYSLANYNFYLTDLGYNFSTRTLFFIAEQDSWINENIGLGLLIVKFKTERAPDYRNVSATINGAPAKDMLKNYTFLDGTVKIYEENSTYIQSCKYLQIFFYIFENHTIINESPIDVNIGPQWNSTTYIPSSSTLVYDTVPVRIELESSNTENNTEIEQSQEKITDIVVPLMVVFSLSGLLIIGVNCWKRSKS